MNVFLSGLGSNTIKYEITSISNIFHSDYFLNQEKKIILEHLDSDIVHFSCHGYFDFNDPLSSGIAINENDVLSVKDIFNSKISSHLVTLSACQTGINKIKHGDELIGFTRSLLYSGVSSIVVSLWSPNAHVTKEIMVEFYIQIKFFNKSIPEALQQAQKKIIRNKQYSDVYYWAPFILIGDVPIN